MRFLRFLRRHTEPNLRAQVSGRMEELTSDQTRELEASSAAGPERIEVLIRRGAVVELRLEVVRAELEELLNRQTSEDSRTDEDGLRIAQLRASVDASEAELSALWERFGRWQSDQQRQPSDA